MRNIKRYTEHLRESESSRRSIEFDPPKDMRPPPGSPPKGLTNSMDKFNDAIVRAIELANTSDWNMDFIPSDFPGAYYEFVWIGRKPDMYKNERIALHFEVFPLEEDKIDSNLSISSFLTNRRIPFNVFGLREHLTGNPEVDGRLIAAIIVEATRIMARLLDEGYSISEIQDIPERFRFSYDNTEFVKKMNRSQNIFGRA
jgi:hypothetical protein